MPDCEKYQELISRMIDGELSEAEKDELAAHVASCPDCGRLYTAFSSVSDLIKDDLEEPPAALRKNVMAAVSGERNKVVSIRQRGRLIALAACFALVIAGSASLGIFSRKGAASLTAVRAPTDTMAESGTASEEKNQLVTSDAAANAAIDRSSQGFVQSTAADTATISGPGGDYKTSDADVVSRLTALLASSGESAAPDNGQNAAESYTVSLPGRDSISVTVDGDKLICQEITGGERFSASGSASDFLALLAKMSPVK